MLRRLLPGVLVLFVGGCGASSSQSSATATAASPAASSARVASGDWPTFDYNAARSGVETSGAGISAGSLGRLALRKVPVDGVVDSAPIELSSVKVRGRRRDVVVVTTTYGRTVAVDPGSGARLWEFVPAGVHPGGSQVSTMTPVADPDRRYVYAASPNGVVHKLSLSTGRQVWARSVTLNPRREKMDSALNLSGPYVVVGTGGYYGDAPPYDGHVALLSRASGRIAHVWNTECSNIHHLINPASCPVTGRTGDSAIWGRAGAVIEPGSHRILVSTGNGPFNGRTDWAQSALELAPNASRLLHSWTPRNEASLSGTDTDIGSSSPALVPTYHGFRLAVQGTKESVLHLLNLRRLNGTRGGAGGRLGGEVSQVSSPGGGQVLTAPLAGRVGGRVLVFVADDSGTTAYALVGGRHPRLRRAWSSGTPGTSPVLAGGLLYVYNELGGSIVIREPGSGRVLRTLAAGHGHWNSPIVVSGRIIEPTGNYHDGGGSSVIDIWHVPGR